ncbi:Sister chromatid cohesion 1 protein 4, putative isoform 4 [Hibiscus syriacus]|uniref:Sister chromatid cohesion 1 protein 4, putative isoform 4 n=1 Tax=Hibiscus syriacus TaxID=106335 RepID=A0A6A2XTD4_HIBSY|nr:sister chromatid cohesion 1 protein 4-like [Hibiscus syriacus]KAE8673120.1 Sister chromatid cohesion 1 protein 4, putative isoform 4 [Hibiscus syriacus]
MFYSQFILAKKGPLGTIWIAAHLERKLRKNQVADTDIGDSVDSILFPDVPIALRLSSHLLLGVVRIYSRKVNYLFDDCSEALLKIKQAFRSTAVDLPPEESTAPYHSITLPETFDLDDFELPDNEIFQGNYVDHHISSREQITLQDTMGDMVYSTSQFGLDERFGDGDTSQIGLLDEELVLDQVVLPGSVEVSEYDQGSDVPQKQDPSDLEAVPMDCSGDQVEGLAANSGFVDNDEDVGTPGLEEVPSLSGVHKALADHVESENHNLTENWYVENASNKSKFLHGDNGPVDQSLHNAINCDAIVHVPLENGCHISDMEKEQTKQQGNSVHDALSVECTSVVGTIRGSDGLDKVEDMDNGAMHSMDRTDGECAESPNCSNVTFDLEDHSRRTCSSSIYVRASDGCLENGQASLKSEIGNCAQTTDNLEEPCSAAKAIASDPSCPLESPSRPTVVDGEAQACQERNDSENLKNPIVDKDLSSLHVLGSDSLAAAEQNLVDLSGREEEVRAPGASIEVQVEACQTQMSEPALCDDQLENSNNCAKYDLPAPEKLLSAPEGPLNKPSDLLGNSTPDKEVLAENDEIDAGTKLISGKKRSLTESTLTIESINSVESFGRPGSRRTADSVPDDDDLLSSILVGRSSVFKMKPTPRLEVASMKRARSAPRSRVTKRKVLMDDTMVLHGDTIRQQLVNTEDIRRIRKKAPCTRPEISLIQRKFLEDEIFSEPIFTGISGDLASLHSESYDLSSIRISEGEENHASSEVAKNPECSVKPNIAEGGTEGSSVLVILGNDKQARSSGTLNAQQDSYAVDDVPQLLQHEPFGGITKMEIDRVNIEVANAANHSVLTELRVSSLTDLVTGDAGNIIAGEVTNTMDGSILNNVTCLLPDQKMGTQPGEDASESDMRNDKVSHPTEVLEHDVEGIFATETGSKATDELLLEESTTNTSVEVSMTDYPSPVGNGTDFRATIETGESVNVAQNAYETGRGKAGVADEIQVEDAVLYHDDKGTICKDSKECKLDSTYSEKVHTALKNTSLLDGETPIFQEVDAVNEEMISLADNRAEREDVAVVNDTEFLNVDDNELGDDDEDDMPCGDEGRLLENSGWSSRTRAVAKYLQKLFEDEAVNGQKVVSMDGLLGRKTRKEASRMFFETLVLKTRDYIHVEQVKPFDNICIKPRAKLMKSSF